VRDIVTKDSVRFFHPGSVSSLIGGIREMVEHPKESKERAKNGAKIVKNHTWEKRMERIIQELPQ
jgi:spore maturation protein CgeB